MKTRKYSAVVVQINREAGSIPVSWVTSVHMTMSAATRAADRANARRHLGSSAVMVAVAGPLSLADQLPHSDARLSSHPAILAGIAYRS